MSYRHLLVPLDGSPLSDAAAAAAIQLAGDLKARITFFHAQPGLSMALVGIGEPVDPRTIDALTKAAQQETEEILKRASEQAAAAGIESDSRSAVHPIPYEAIIAAAAACEADLIVMASHGRRGIGALVLGSETQKVLIHSSLPVLVVR